MPAPHDSALAAGDPAPASGETHEDLRDLKDRYERKARALRNRPELGKSAGHVRVRLVGDVARALDSGGHTNNSARVGDGASPDPTPAELLRHSLAASLALGYRVWAARFDVPIDSVEVALYTDDDARGQLLLETDVVAGWQRIHITATITSPAARADVERVFTCANRHCLVLATLSPAIARVLELQVVPRASGTAIP